MASKTLKGLTIEIGGDTTKLGKALESVNGKSRDLSAELGQINKLLKLDPKNTDLLAQKQKVLAAAIENSAEKLETLKKAEKQVQEQFKRGEVSEEQVRQLQREIIKTEKELKDYQKEAKEAADQTGNFGEVAKKTASKLGVGLKATGDLAKKGLAIVAAAAAAAAAGLAKAATSAASYADEILTASTVTGISTQKLQEYSYAAELVDVSVETITKSHAKQIKSMKAVQDGTKLAVEAYESLGVSVLNADGSLRDGETVYWEVIDALGKMENETERDAVAMQILGKSAQELNPLIEAGSERMAELASEAKEVGAVLSDDALASLGAFDDGIQRLKGSANAAKNALGTVLLPELVKLTDGGAELLAEFTNTLNATGGGLGGFVTTMEKMAPEIAAKFSELATEIFSNVVNLIPALGDIAVGLISNVATTVLGMAPRLVETAAVLITTVIDAVTKLLPQLIDVFITIPDQLIRIFETFIPQVTTGALKLLFAVIDAVDRLLPVLIKAIPDIVLCIINGLLDMIPELIDGALILLLAVVDAIPLLIEKLVPAIPQIIVAIVNALLNAYPKLYNAVITLYLALAKAIPQACVSLLKALPQIWNTMVSFFSQLPSKLANIGVSIIQGLWSGMKGHTTWLKNQIRSWVGDVTKFLKKLFGINSPSKVTAYMGEMLDEGLAKGIEDNTAAPKDAMADMTNDVINAAGHVDGVAIERQISYSYSANAAATAAQNAGLLGKLDKILAAIERGQIITIDSNALVGATVNPMNNALGQRRVLAGRGAL